MKNNPKDPDHHNLHHYSSWSFSKLMAFFVLLTSISYLFYSLQFITHSHHHCDQNHNQNQNPITIPIIHTTFNTQTQTLKPEKTNLSHIVFGIAASAKLWNHRKEYIKLWWKPNQMRGTVWLEQAVKSDPGDENLLPPVRISENTSRFKYKNKKGDRSGIRISRIVSETVRLGTDGPG